MLRHSEEEEKSSVRTGPCHIFRHIFFKKRKHQIAFAPVQVNAFEKIGIKAAGSHELRSDILVENRRTEVERLLAHIYLVKHIRMSEYPPEPESRSEYL